MRIEPDDLARQVEAEHALAAFDCRRTYVLTGACAHGRDRVERIALAEKVVAGMERADVLDEHVEVRELALVHALREAGLRERAGRAEVQRVAVVGGGARIGPREDRAAHVPPRTGVRWRART